MRVRATEANGVVDVKVLMKHDMESGQRKDANGKVISAWHITNIVAKVADKEVFRGQFGTAVSKDPFLNFKLKGPKKGDEIFINWTDTKGDTRTDKAVIS